MHTSSGKHRVTSTSPCASVQQTLPPSCSAQFSTPVSVKHWLLVFSTAVVTVDVTTWVACAAETVALATLAPTLVAVVQLSNLVGLLTKPAKT